jgi:hypothetical protein
MSNDVDVDFDNNVCIFIEGEMKATTRAYVVPRIPFQKGTLPAHGGGSRSTCTTSLFDSDENSAMSPFMAAAHLHDTHAKRAR